MMERTEDYAIRSNRESGYGRYDVMLVPKAEGDPAVILEFKKMNPKRDQSMEEAAEKALRQIIDRQYDRDLVAGGIPPERILKYGIAFEGKTCIVRKG